MQLKTGIKKLESGIEDKQPFCNCFYQYQKAMIDAVYDHQSFDETAFTLPECSYCNKCKKPVNVPFEQGVIEDINIAYDSRKVK
jgi:hypothetical protein